MALKAAKSCLSNHRYDVCHSSKFLSHTVGKLIFKKDKKYTFADYFDFQHLPEEIAAEFGYSWEAKRLDFPRTKAIAPADIVPWQERFYEVLPKITLTSEMAKRDFLIAPVLWEMIRHVPAKIHVEYPLEIDDKLGGSLDYLIRSKQALIVIEAKKGDLEKGFNQLTVEMIALNQQEPAEVSEQIYGAVSIGELWRFGILERKTKHIYKDLHTYRVPEDIEKLFLILIGILKQP